MTKCDKHRLVGTLRQMEDMLDQCKGDGVSLRQEIEKLDDKIGLLFNGLLMMGLGLLLVAGLAVHLLMKG